MHVSLEGDFVPSNNNNKDLSMESPNTMLVNEDLTLLTMKILC
jgi:hypothetical protein